MKELNAKKVMIVYGTRPELIKLVSTIKGLEKSKHKVILVDSGQHSDLLKPIKKLFSIEECYTLKGLKKKRSLSDMVGHMVPKLSHLMEVECPNIVLGIGDTTTVMCTALSAFYTKTKFMHLESGIHNHDKFDPYPEEGNRRVISQLADYHLCQSEQHLKTVRERGSDGVIVGNPGLDAVKMIAKKYKKKKQVLITMHRRENWGKPIQTICGAIHVLARAFPDYTFIIACHPNPIVKDVIDEMLGNVKNVIISKAIDFHVFIKVMGESVMLITDSGGAPQEAPFVKTPVLITRDAYESYSVIENNQAKLVGTNPIKICKEFSRLMSDKKYYNAMLKKPAPYGNGTSYKLIIKQINKVIE